MPNNSKILLLGSHGMLGRMFTATLSGVFDPNDLVFLSHEDLDITDSSALKEKFLEIQPTHVINCAAYTAVDKAEDEKELALKINGEAVKNMAILCSDLAATLIHFSTDYVFDGENPKGYREDDEPNPINFYGESKLKGEKELRENCEKHYIIRTSWLYGPFGRNFVDTMLSLFEKGEKVRVVGDQFGSPTFNYDLADPNLIMDMAAQKLPFGIYHRTNSGSTSWFSFANEIKKITKSDVSLEEITTMDYPTKAKRPACSILINTKLPDLDSWQEGLSDYLLNFRPRN